MLVILFFLVADQPPKPPTKAEALLRRLKANAQALNLKQNIKICLHEMKHVFGNTTFINIIFFMSILLATNIFQSLFLSESLRPIFSNYFFHSNSDTNSSYIIILYEIEAIVSSIM